LRKVFDGQGERAQAVEADDAMLVINCHDDAGDVPFLVLARPPAKPVVESWLATRKRRTVVLCAERLDSDCQAALSKKFAMSLERSDQFLGRGWRIGHRVEEDVAIGAGEHHALMFVQDPSRALIGKVSGR
jgi:hypothetical protein